MHSQVVVAQAFNPNNSGSRGRQISEFKANLVRGAKDIECCLESISPFPEPTGLRTTLGFLMVQKQKQTSKHVFLPSSLPPFLPPSLPSSLPSFLPSFILSFFYLGFLRQGFSV